MVEVVDVEQLEIHALGARVRVRAQLLDDFDGRPGGTGETRLLDGAPGGLRPPLDLRGVGSAHDGDGRREHDRTGIATGGLAGAAHVVDLAREVGHRMERHVELVGEARRERGRALRARTAQDEWRVWPLDGLGRAGEPCNR